MSMQNERDAGARIAARNHFHQTISRRLVISQACSIGVIAALVADRIYLDHHPPPPLIVLTDSHGNQVEAQPLNEPVMSDADLVEWVAQAAVAPYNFDYIHYRATLTHEAQPFFTNRGWNNVIESMKERKNLDEIERSQTVVEGVVLRPPALVGPGDASSGTLTWVYEVPILATFRNTDGRREQRLMVRMTVVRTSPTFHIKGVAVDSYVTRPFT